MALFDQTFQDHIQLELLSRTFRENIQNVLIPHVRVTSLVEGNLNGKELHGFTLGNVDIKKTPSLDDYFNTRGQGTAIGLTYTGPDNTAERVVLDTGNKKLPPPGVTNVSISTQSTGGFIFKATVQLKFYGKEQYDFIWQTMLRPGNPITIEYGHTRTQEDQKDLEFFQELDGSVINEFIDNLRNNVSLKTTRNSGRVMGLVSNFRVRLNEQNEYEAEIELINALEFLFTISPEDTFLDYGKTSDEQQTGLKYLSKSIRSNFGWEKGEDYEPKYDNIFKQVLKDGIEPPSDPVGAQTRPEGQSHTEAAKPVPDWRQYILIPFGVAPEYDPSRTAEHAMVETNEDIQEQAQSHAIENSGNVYVSLEYFLSKLLNDILKVSYYDRENAAQCGLAATAEGLYNFTETEIVDHQSLRDEELDILRTYHAYFDDRGLDSGVTLPTTGAKYTARTKQDLHEFIEERSAHYRKTQVTYKKITQAVGLGQTATSTEVELDSVVQPVNAVGYWPTLRSVNIKDVIINNVNLYNVPEDELSGHPNRPIPPGILKSAGGVRGFEKSGYFWRSHKKAYQDRFGDDVENKAIFGMFKYNPSWENKRVYDRPEWSGGRYPKRTNFEGIFINYEKIRNAFIGSKSVGEAIQKVLNMVNAATSGILKLKMRHIESVEVRGMPGITPAGTGVAASSPELIRVNRIKIYDDNALLSPSERSAQPYTFFRGYISEAMSYNFDLSLPGSVAATVMSNTFDPTELSAAGGDPQKKAFISYGYALKSVNPPELALKSLVNLNNEGASDKCEPTATEQRTEEDDEADEDRKTLEEVEQDAFYRQILGYKELEPPKMKENAIRDGLYNVVPSAGKINIRLQGLDGFRFGDMFSVHNILPHPFDDGNSIFMVTGYKHDINSQGWFTDLDGTMIASIPDNIKQIQEALRAEEGT